MSLFLFPPEQESLVYMAIVNKEEQHHRRYEYEQHIWIERCIEWYRTNNRANSKYPEDVEDVRANNVPDRHVWFVLIGGSD